MLFLIKIENGMIFILMIFIICIWERIHTWIIKDIHQSAILLWRLLGIPKGLAFTESLKNLCIRSVTQMFSHGRDLLWIMCNKMLLRGNLFFSAKNCEANRANYLSRDTVRDRYIWYSSAVARGAFRSVPRSFDINLAAFDYISARQLIQRAPRAIR